MTSLLVCKLDRLSRSLRDVLTIMERLADAKAGIRNLTEAIATTTPAGRMTMRMVGAIAEFERSMRKERNKAGLNAARQGGRIGGCRPAVQGPPGYRFPADGPGSSVTTEEKGHPRQIACKDLRQLIRIATPR